MRSRFRPKAQSLVTLAVAGLGLYRRVLRPGHLRWGATAEEVTRALPGDDRIADPDLTATRAITIRRRSGDVWPWIAQLGQGRGGFYSYDVLENLVGCDIHSFMMSQKMLRGIRDRAERRSEVRAASPGGR